MPVTRMLLLPAVIIGLTAAGPIRGHHSLRMIDTSVPVWVSGTVVSYGPISPHTMFELEETTADGQVRRWTIEGPFPGRLNRILAANRMEAGTAVLEAGDVIEVCGFYPIGETAQAQRFVHGHVLVMRDGRMQSWGPYGKTDNCVRPGDAVETWVDFLRSDPLARDLWCGSRSRPQLRVESLAPEEFRNAVDAGLAEPCP